MTSTRSSFADRLLAEAVRLQEADGAEPIDDPAAEQAARDVDGVFEQRLVTRASKLEVAGPLSEALDQTLRAALMVVGIGMVLGLVAGAATARTALGVDEDQPVNFFLVLISLLGVQTVLLVAWAVVMLLRPRALGRGSLGGLALAGARRLAGTLHGGPAHVVAIRAVTAVFAGSPVGKWTLSAISHAVWLSFNVAVLVLVVVLLSARHYTFVWQTTILSEKTYVPMTRAIAAGPRALGFAVPTDQQIRESRWPRETTPSQTKDQTETEIENASEAWSGLLVGSLVVYGFGPRLLLLALCLNLRRRSASRYRLDTNRAGFRRLQDRLLPTRQSLGVVDPVEDLPAVAVPPADTRATGRPQGPPAVLGFEMDMGDGPWPPPLPGVKWNDLGCIDDRSGRESVLSSLRGDAAEPSVVVVVCELTNTPDRGVEAFLGEVQAAVSRPVAIVLTAGQRLRSRFGAADVAGRVDDWRGVALRCGVDDERCLELDLDHATDQSLHGLRVLVNGEPGRASSAKVRRLEEAFDLIAGRVATWSVPPDTREQAELHREIARLHRDENERWRQLLDLPGSLSADPVGQMRKGADRVRSLLPDRLRRSPKWAAAGGLTGALGCVAAATLLTPVAIASLPMWSVIGAGIAVLLQPDQRGQTPSRGLTPSLADAIRAATLFAVLLELQGRDEASITRILDRVFDDDDAAMETPSEVRSWLDETAHRFDMSLATEAES